MLYRAPYRRSIPTLTMTAARRGTPLRECVGIINNDAYRDFPPDKRICAHSSPFSARVEEAEGVYKILQMVSVKRH